VVVPKSLPFTVAAKVTVDLGPRPSEEDRLLLGDFHRARVGLPLAESASAAELIAAECRTVRVDDDLWLRSTCGKPMSRLAAGAPPFASNGEGVEPLREAHRRVVVERLPYRYQSDDLKHAADLGFATDPRAAGLAREMFRLVIARGAFWTLTAVDQVVQAVRAGQS
jgi:hypothetical protein